MIRKEIRLPVLAIVLLSFGGWLLHVRIHPVSFDPASPSNPAFFVPFIVGLLGIVAVPLLLNFRSTFVVGYLMNGIGVIIGTLAMTAFSVDKLPSPLTPQGILTGTLLADILILFPKLFLGQVVLLHYYPNGMGRMFTAFWWTRHFVYLGVVFALGAILWR
ncbi:MAG: hypothetical protein PHD74_09355 [Candidatus Krumholzibacteria bacterium]|nr:hypothetical protein [Candidatus Krumholzibacteria bacterium]